MNLRRAAFKVTLAVALLAAPFAAEAEQAAKLYRIGWLSPGSTTSHGEFLEVFRQELRDHGYVEGRNITIEARWAEGREDRLRGFAAELARLNVDVMVVAAPQGVSAAKQATTQIPIVLAAGGFVGTGAVGSLARPGGNVTGLSNLAEELIAKLLELLKEAAPTISRVAVLSNPNHPAAATFRKELQAAAQALGVTLLYTEVRTPQEFEEAFATMRRERAGGLVVLPDPMFMTERNRIADLTVRSRLPATHMFKEHAAAGGLLVYGVNLRDNVRRAAVFVDKILKGAKPQPPRRAADQVRAGHQPQDREGARSDDSAVIAAPRRSRDPVAERNGGQKTAHGINN